MSRRFTSANSDVMEFAAGAAAATDGTAITFLFIWKPISVVAGGLLYARRTDNARIWAINPFSDGIIYYTCGSSDNLNTYSAGSWRVDAISRPAGSTLIRAHQYTYGGSWSHFNGDATISSSGNGSADFIKVGQFANNAEYLDANLAAVAIFNSNLADATIESLTTSGNSILAASPAVYWEFNQASTATAVTDLAGGGAAQTSITGTSVVADEPPGWSYSGTAVTEPSYFIVRPPGRIAPGSLWSPLTRIIDAPTTSTVTPIGIAVAAATGTPTASQTLTVAPSGVAVAAATGTPTVAQNLTAAPSGIAVTAATGTPTVAQSFTVTPTGIGVTVAAGTPVVGAAVVAPTGIGVTTATGTPTVAQTFSVSPAGIAVSVAAGTPGVSAGSVAPNGIAVPAAAGTPTVAWAGSVGPSGIAVPVALGAPTVFVPGSVIHRPNTGTIARPNTGTVSRPNTGVVSRP